MTASVLRPLFRIGAAMVLAAGLAGCQAAARPVVVELYEAQGCSSCPPANANLAAVADRPDVIALNFAVTYWDQLGWKDTFARPEFTARQWTYAKSFHRSDVFTPEVVVNGQRDGVGANPGDFARLLGGGGLGSAGPSVTLSAVATTIAAAPRPAQPADVWLVRYDPRTLQVPIKAGENSGRTLPHRNIVKELVKLGSWNGEAEALRLPAPSEPQLVSVILVQSPGGGPILAAVRG
jgi:hypothetical protein